MSPVTQITITGFAGRMAQLITTYLLANHPSVKINGVARNASKLPENIKGADNIEIFEGDAYDKDVLLKALKGSQVVICAYLGDNALMIDGQKFLIDASIEAGVPRYIASDWTCDYRNNALGEIPMKDPMKVVYEYLQGKKEIEGVHMLVGAFIEVVFMRLFADDAHTRIQYFGTGNEGIDFSTMPDSAAWTVEAAVVRSAVGFIQVRGERASMKDIAKLLEEEYRTKIVLENCGTMDDLKHMVDNLRKEKPDDIYAWMGLLYLHWMSSEEARLDGVENDRYPQVKPTTVRGFLKQHTLKDVSTAY